jgi:Matrixin
LKLGSRVGTRVVSLRWNRMPIRYFITNRDVPGVTAPQLQAAIARAFDRWTTLASVTLSTQFAGLTNSDPFTDDNASVIGFRSRPDLDRTLGATTFTVDNTTGEVLESDIFLNTAFPWSVAAGGETSRYDVESIAVHEIGHLLGLGHSMLGETELLDIGRRRVLAKRAVMFPIAYPAGNIEDRTPEADDIAGLSDSYGTNTFRAQTGSISGKVTLGGAGVFGAHVTAFNSSTNTTVATFVLTQAGDFVISGLAPGLYIVRAEPLDDADLESFFDEDTTVNINFKPTYYAKLVAAPAGGAGKAIEIKVQAK